MTSAPVRAPSGPPAGIWSRRRLGRRVAVNLLRLLPIRTYGRLFPRPAIGLCYHTVSDLSLPHVRNLYRYKSPADFEADLIYLKRNFQVVSYDELEAEPRSAMNRVILTFDDGLAECYTVARPLLLKHGLPCTFFVSPPHLDNRRMFSFDRASLALDALKSLEPEALRARLDELGALSGIHFEDVPAFARWLTSWMRTIDDEGDRILDEICALLGVDAERYLSENRPYMTSDEVRTLAGDGFTIGAHGLRHVALGAFSNDEIGAEITRSCQAVSELTGRERVPFAFPFDANGVDRSFLASLRAENPGIGLMFDTRGLRRAREFMINRMIVDWPGSVRGRSNLPGYLRQAYLGEITHRFGRGDDRADPDVRRPDPTPAQRESTPSVSVCVTTFLRPEGLTRLLRGLDQLTFEKSGLPALEIVVVDNDPAGSAEEICRRLAPELRWPLRYVHEPRRGVSQARNRAVSAARGSAEFIAFIDDDEVPEPTWLDELLAVQLLYDADVVSGPVVSRFESEVPSWVREGRFFDRERLPTGSRKEHPGAGNVLIRVAALEGMEPPFDDRFGLTGGEDTHLFLRLASAGRTMVWADEAVAYEYVPATRARASWILRRIYRGANTWSQCERELHPSLAVGLVRAAKGVSRIAYGLALLPVACLVGRRMIVRSLWYVCFGAGNLTGLAGIRYQEYRTTHGR